MSPNEVVRSLTDAELRQATSEALAWRKQGVLSGEHLRQVAQRLYTDAGVEEFDANRMADALVVEEAAARFARQAAAPKGSS